jgi:hypothetical protein
MKKIASLDPLDALRAFRAAYDGVTALGTEYGDYNDFDLQLSLKPEHSDFYREMTGRHILVITVNHDDQTIFAEIDATCIAMWLGFWRETAWVHELAIGKAAIHRYTTIGKMRIDDERRDDA